MPSQRDPVERAAEDDADLYEISTWEPRSRLDRLATSIYAGLSYGAGTIVVAVALAITLSLLLTPALIVAEVPLVGIFFVLSVVPAGVLAAYIWYADITTAEPLGLLVATFVLAVLLATFAAVLNSAGGQVFQQTTLLGSVLFFFLIVGPVEETVKLLAVRVYAYRSDSFDAVIDGAVYGAVAGLGFATIENAIYIGRHLAGVGVEAGLFVAATEIATTRALAGPGHVLYSAIAGYYLGLAKFNPQNAGPLIVKGLLVAAIFHGTYNVAVGIVPGAAASLTGLDPNVTFVAFIVSYQVLVGSYLYQKVARYRRAYKGFRDGVGESTIESELTEFEPPNRS